MNNYIKSIDDLHLLTINVGLARHNGDWNWKNVKSPFVRLYYVTRGTAKVILPNEILELQPHHMYLIPSFTKHSYVNNGLFEHYYIHIYEDAHSFSGFLEDLEYPLDIPAENIDLELCKRLMKINPSMHLSNSDPTTYDNTLTLMQSIVRNKHRMLCDRIESRGILYQLISKFLKYAKPKIEINDSRIQKCIAYIRRHIDVNIKIEDLAMQANVSKDHFIRMFKKETRMTPMQYISQKKIEKAQLLLITEDKTVKEIAFMLSYNDQSYFNRLFKKHTGISPLNYRKNYSHYE